MNKIRKHIFFEGMVQGVGFRYKSYYIAESLGLTGWGADFMTFYFINGFLKL